MLLAYLEKGAVPNTIHLVLLIHLVYLIAFSYTRSFLMLSCSGSVMQKTSQINIIAGSVAYKLRAFIMSWDFDFIPSLWPNLCTKPHKVQWREICHIFNGLYKHYYRTLWLMAKSMHVTPKVRRKGMCHT